MIRLFGTAWSYSSRRMHERDGDDAPRRLGCAGGRSGGGSVNWAFIPAMLRIAQTVDTYAHLDPRRHGRSWAGFGEVDGARLFLADWGYNTAEDRASVGAAGGVRRLSLDCFAGLARLVSTQRWAILRPASPAAFQRNLVGR
jgi:hypothetical protein